MRREIEPTLKQMVPTKALRPNSFCPLFYQKYWSTVGTDVCRLVPGVLNRGDMPKNLNHTIISLILNTKNPESMKDLRPISLCNVMYKPISKTIANRLKPIL